MSLKCVTVSQNQSDNLDNTNNLDRYMLIFIKMIKSWYLTKIQMMNGQWFEAAHIS